MEKNNFYIYSFVDGGGKCICPVLHMDLQHGRKYVERIENQITIKA